MENLFCALGCQSAIKLYTFPNREKHAERRKKWLDFFDLEEPNIDDIYACEKHFSPSQTNKFWIGANAVPDVPIICNATVYPFKRKPKNWRQNVIVVTPRDPEFTIYRHETGVFPQNLFGVQPKVPFDNRPEMRTPRIKSISCSMSTQTNKHLCGLVEFSDVINDFRFNCFHCCARFSLSDWKAFVGHLKTKHLSNEEAILKAKIVLQDHDYTIRAETQSDINNTDQEIIRKTPQIKLTQLPSSIKSINKSDKENPRETPQKKPTLQPTLLNSPRIRGNITKSNKESLRETSQKKTNQLPKNKPFNINLADQLIDYLNETILNPIFLNNSEDNIVIIKNTNSEIIETSSFLENYMNSAHNSTTSSTYFSNKRYSPVKPAPKNTRSIFTLRDGQKFVPSRRSSLMRDFVPPLAKHKHSKQVQRNIAKQTLKHIDVFEKVYSTIKTRPPKIDDVGDLAGNNMSETAKAPTPLSRFLKRTQTQTSTSAAEERYSEEHFKQKPTELVFEYTPRDIILFLLENIKNYPVLWEFHDQPFNKIYNQAIQDLCKIINDKWSLNINPLKMRRSLNRIFRFYRFMLPCESINEFSYYFDILSLFLPPVADEIPRARCPYCSMCFERDVMLRRHLVEKHKSLKWPFKCPECWERFRERDEYELHKLLKHYIEIFKCEQCEKRFTRRHLYNKHVSGHQRTLQRRLEPAQEYSCLNCDQIYKSISGLSRHERICMNMGEVERFQCHLCPKSYTLRNSFNMHLRKHRKEMDYICEVCGKGFYRNAMLQSHMICHTGEKITCNICNLKLRKCNLGRHLSLVHVALEGTIESTFRKQCYHYKKFQFPTPLRLRRRISNKPRKYQCKVCQINFETLKLLKDHNKEQHNTDIKMVPCKICHIEFKFVNNLKRHYREKHKLHVYQVFKLFEQNEDLNTVLAMTDQELNAMTEADLLISKSNSVTNSTLDAERMNSDSIQDEIMKAVETIDGQEIRVDDDHSMNEFFIDLFE